MGLPFSDQVAVITGASSGVGKAIAQSLATGGVKLCVVGRNLKTLQKTFKDARAIQADLRVEDDIKELKRVIEHDFGRVDILVHSAGIWSKGPIEGAPASDFDELYLLNVRAPYLLTQALIPMLKGQKGQVVFINSSVGLRSKAGIAQYAATKHALKALADGLRDEVNESGVRVLSVYLGSTATPMQERIHEIEGHAYHPELLLQPSDVASIVVGSLLLPRTAEVTDITIRPMKKPE
jgi:NADP-dependent 3-hydroxy acid dehydrogenase YdfG